VLHLNNLAFSVSLLFAILARWSISVACKGLTGRARGEKILGLEEVTWQFS
jgi:hypothetical protein